MRILAPDASLGQEAFAKDAINAVIIAAKANYVVVSRLIDGAKRAFTSANIDASRTTLIEVAGALEIPLALKKIASTNHWNAFVVLGAVIKGKTDHYEHVARLAQNGVLKVALEHRLPLGNGILTVHTLEQAFERADGPCGNLGFDAAKAAIGLSSLFLQLDKVL
ncbi:MAG TPA: 6,7-dimethyl-8-ribityllumazine synthase [Myxococcota bacterium]|nr:6,7-dimethyl-8-ribityllumazine synthase [Myxococcota bacterium]